MRKRYKKNCHDGCYGVRGNVQNVIKNAIFQEKQKTIYATLQTSLGYSWAHIEDGKYIVYNNIIKNNEHGFFFIFRVGYPIKKQNVRK